MYAKYEAIAARLRRDIDAGVYKDRLPSERNLARQLGTTNNTLRKAQNLLIAEGRLVKRQPQGTFITEPIRPTIRISFLMTMLSTGVTDAIGAEIRSAFPGIDLRFHDRNDVGIEKRDCDLIGIPNLSPVPYQDLAVPFESHVMAELPIAHYFESAFEVHRTRGLYYGLPILFSPCALVGDQAILDAAGTDPDPYSLDLSALTALAELARKHKIPLWHQTAVMPLLRSLVFATAAIPGVLRSLDPDRCETLLRQWSPLFAPDLIAREFTSLPNCGALLAWTCRQSMPLCDPEQHRLYAWPRELRHCTGVAGEFFLLNRDSQHRELALRVALHFLSAPVQSILGRNGMGIPVLKSAALDCLGTTPWRDDLFLTEAGHICANSAREHDFLHRLQMLTRDLIAEELSMNAFCRFVRNEIDMTQKRHTLRTAFMQQQTDSFGALVPAFG